MRDFILGHGDAGEMGDAADGIGVDGHGSSGSGVAPAYSRAAFTTTTGSRSVLWRNPGKRGMRFRDKCLDWPARRHFAPEGSGLARQHWREVAGPLRLRLRMQWSKSTAGERKLGHVLADRAEFANCPIDQAPRRAPTENIRKHRAV